MPRDNARKVKHISVREETALKRLMKSVADPELYQTGLPLNPIFKTVKKLAKLKTQFRITPVYRCPAGYMGFTADPNDKNRAQDVAIVVANDNITNNNWALYVKQFHPIVEAMFSDLSTTQSFMKVSGTAGGAPEYTSGTAGKGFYFPKGWGKYQKLVEEWCYSNGAQTFPVPMSAIPISAGFYVVPVGTPATISARTILGIWVPCWTNVASFSVNGGVDVRTMPARSITGPVYDASGRFLPKKYKCAITGLPTWERYTTITPSHLGATIPAGYAPWTGVTDTKFTERLIGLNFLTGCALQGASPSDAALVAAANVYAPTSWQVAEDDTGYEMSDSTAFQFHTPSSSAGDFSSAARFVSQKVTLSSDLSANNIVGRVALLQQHRTDVRYFALEDFMNQEAVHHCLLSKEPVTGRYLPTLEEAKFIPDSDLGMGTRALTAMCVYGACGGSFREPTVNVSMLPVQLSVTLVNAYERVDVDDGETDIRPAANYAQVHDLIVESFQKGDGRSPNEIPPTAPPAQVERHLNQIVDHVRDTQLTPVRAFASASTLPFRTGGGTGGTVVIPRSASVASTRVLPGSTGSGYPIPRRSPPSAGTMSTLRRLGNYARGAIDFAAQAAGEAQGVYDHASRAVNGSSRGGRGSSSRSTLGGHSWAPGRRTITPLRSPAPRSTGSSRASRVASILSRRGTLNRVSFLNKIFKFFVLNIFSSRKRRLHLWMPTVLVGGL